jgi:hypothetical protein
LFPQAKAHVDIQPTSQAVSQVAEQPLPQVPLHPLQPPLQLLHPLQELVQVPRHKPVQAPLHELEVLVIVSFAKLSTRVIKLESIFEVGIDSPFTTFFNPAMSFTFNNKSIVFCPCSA